MKINGFIKPKRTGIRKTVKEMIPDCDCEVITVGTHKVYSVISSREDITMPDYFYKEIIEEYDIAGLPDECIVEYLTQGKSSRVSYLKDFKLNLGHPLWKILRIVAPTKGVL